MILLIPPIIIVIRVRPVWRAGLADAAATPSAAVRARTIATSVAKRVSRLSFMPCSSSLGGLQRDLVAARGAPRDQPVLERRDQELRAKRDHGEDEHCGEDPVGVEGAL